MKTLRAFLVIFFLQIITLAFCGIHKKYEINFSQNQFSFSSDDNGALSIRTSLNDAYYPEDSEIGIPVFPLNIAIEPQNKYQTYTLSLKKSLLKKNVAIPNPIVVSTHSDSQNNLSQNNYKIAKRRVHTMPVEYISQSNCGGIEILQFTATPFLYDPASGDLYFIDSITIDIELEQTGDTSYVGRINQRLVSYVRDIILNKNEIDNIIARIPMTSDVYDDWVDYAIITNKNLAPAFTPLANWKTTKGVKTKVYTIEDIDSKYTGATKQLKIKKFLYDLYNTLHLQYALLGGDDSIIPAQGCYGFEKFENYDYVDKTIPTDLYYACFKGNFEWDSNGNGLYGEDRDGMDLHPDIFLTRLPVRSRDDVNAIINKIIEYEKHPRYKHRMLKCGVKTSTIINNGMSSDSEAKSDTLYKKYIQPYWDGECLKFFDTYTDFPNGKNYNLTASNLSTQIGNGYSFLTMDTHGLQQGWGMEDGDMYHAVINGIYQKNNTHTLITTNSCETNAFDSSFEAGREDPCLSESLIRNPDSGVIGYFGSSRKGWTNYWSPNDKSSWMLIDSELYEGNFYRALFSKKYEDKSFGVMVAFSKMERCQWLGLNRLLQYSLNPMGDPEMPIFTEIPKEFDDLRFTVQRDKLQIDTDTKNYRICVMSAGDLGKSHYEVFDYIDYGCTISDFPENVSICITKQNHIPKQYTVCFIQNETISSNLTRSSDYIRIGSDVIANKQPGPVLFKGGKTVIEGSNIVINPGTTVAKGTEVVFKNK